MGFFESDKYLVLARTCFKLKMERFFESTKKFDVGNLLILMKQLIS